MRRMSRTPRRFNERRSTRHLLVAAAAGLLCVAQTSAYAEVRNPNGVAVIVGNKAYDHERVPEVSYAHRDAAAFKRYVIDVLGFDPENIIELLDASQAELWTVFGSERSHEGTTLWSYLHPRGSDVVVYYSGHGVPGLRDKRGYLLPRDADPNTAEINGYPIDVLYENLGKLEDARSVTVYLDACFSGDSHDGMLVRSASPVYVSGELPGEVAEKITVLTAASGQQLASWDEEAKHGLFTEHLLDALYGKGDEDGDGRVTAAEVVEYLLTHMTRAARRVHKRRQEATLNGLPGVVLASASGGMFPERRRVLSDADRRDDEAFAQAQQAGTMAAYEDYLRQYPSGRHATEAQRRQREAERAERREPGEVFRDCEACPELVVVPAGSFMMGSPRSEEGTIRR